jgi:large subunit ribosomal protein L18
MFERRRDRNRTSLMKNAKGQVRLSVHRTSRHIYAQIIDDMKGETLAHASTLDAEF